MKASRAAAAEAEQEAEKERALNQCLMQAESAYHDQWYRECKGQGKLSVKCIDIHELDYEDYLTKYDLTDEEYRTARGITSTSTFALLLDYLGRRDDECSCRLYLENADRLNDTLKSDQDACDRRF